jgi:hypothetical protein
VFTVNEEENDDTKFTKFIMLHIYRTVHEREKERVLIYRSEIHKEFVRLAT